ncbi:MAG TPA: TetR/AcrR family transcriptional regulator [Xanthobacteraceae bacterium]|nr:TetR/AcrR family transcriptional regulator [Xanthobacteraceae bacterium]
MRVSRAKAAENRERVIAAAGALFREKGFGGVSVADVMKAADLTHGGFYGQFGSKDDLVAQACRKASAEAADNWQRTAARAPDEAYAALLLRYLRPSHRDEPGRGCIFAALGADAARSGAAVQRAFADGVEPLIDLLAQSAPGASKAARRRKGVAAMAGLVGALLLARAVGKGELSDEILEATRRELLAAGGR